jgi:hypothetical protein
MIENELSYQIIGIAIQLHRNMVQAFSSLPMKMRFVMIWNWRD